MFFVEFLCFVHLLISVLHLQWAVKWKQESPEGKQGLEFNHNNLLERKLKERRQTDSTPKSPWELNEDHLGKEVTGKRGGRRKG